MVMHVAMWQLLLGLFIVLGYPRDDTRSVGLLYSCYLIIGEQTLGKLYTRLIVKCYERKATACLFFSE